MRLRTELIRSRPLRVNAALCELLGTSRDELLAWDAFFLGEPELAQDEARQRVAMRTGGLDRYTCERLHTRPQGDRVWLRQTCSTSKAISRPPSAAGGTRRQAMPAARSSTWRSGMAAMAATSVRLERVMVTR